MTIFGHLAELRMRLVRSLLAVAVGSTIILVFYDAFLKFLTQPYRNICKTRPDFNCEGTLFALGPIEGLTSRMRIAGYGGLIIALPVIMWQLWKFIVPALNKQENKPGATYALTIDPSKELVDNLTSVNFFESKTFTQDPDGKMTAGARAGAAAGLVKVFDALPVLK